MELKKVTNKLVKEYNEFFEKNERYSLADKAIIELFKKFPENTNLKHILLKVCVLNDLYSTNIFATFNMAEHIQSLNIDSELKEGNPGIVNKIAKITLKNKNWNFYSFATKYCNWHNQSKYVIYDSFVDRILKAYRNETHFYDFSNEDLREYPKFLAILENFRNFFDLKEFDFKQIDKFLWMYGKQVFKK